MRVGEVVLGKYRIDRILGEGGMGVVVAATNIELDQAVALKLLRPERTGDETAITRALAEARATVRLSGEHTGKVLDVVRLPTGEPVLVMKLLDGEDLAKVLARTGAFAEQRQGVELHCAIVLRSRDSRCTRLWGWDCHPGTLVSFSALPTLVNGEITPPATFPPTALNGQNAAESGCRLHPSC